MTCRSEYPSTTKFEITPFASASRGLSSLSALKSTVQRNHLKRQSAFLVGTLSIHSFFVTTKPEYVDRKSLKPPYLVVEISANGDKR